MFKVGELLVFRKDVYEVLEIQKKAYNDTDYYVLASLKDKSLTIKIPTDSDAIREIISKKEVEELIKKIPNIETVNLDGNDKSNEVIYKELLASGNHEDLIKIIKTTYLRNKERLDNKKKIGDRDDNYFKLAEEYLYNEFAAVLNMTFEEVKEYVEKLTK